MKVNFDCGLDTVWNDLGKEPGVGVGVSLWHWKEKLKPISNVSAVRPTVTIRMLHFHVDTVLSFPTDFLQHLNNRLRRWVGLWQVKHRDLKPGDNYSLS